MVVLEEAASDQAANGKVPSKRPRRSQSSETAPGKNPGRVRTPFTAAQKGVPPKTASPSPQKRKASSDAASTHSNSSHENGGIAPKVSFLPQIVARRCVVIT